ncbi:MAG: hypothetical protein WD066_11625 [Planctomycetaceae bacterium]
MIEDTHPSGRSQQGLAVGIDEYRFKCAMGFAVPKITSSTLAELLGQQGFSRLKLIAEKQQHKKIKSEQMGPEGASDR